MSARSVLVVIGRGCRCKWLLTVVDIANLTIINTTYFIYFLTGAGGGIGRAICLEFAQEGAKVAAVDIQAGNVDETVEQCGSNLYNYI